MDVKDVGLTAEYNGVVYEVRSIALEEFTYPGSNRFRPDISISVGDELFFIDPRKSPSSEFHNSVVVVEEIQERGIKVQSPSPLSFGFIPCCFHRIVKYQPEIDTHDFYSIIESDSM